MGVDKCPYLSMTFWDSNMTALEFATLPTPHRLLNIAE